MMFLSRLLLARYNGQIMHWLRTSVRPFVVRPWSYLQN